MKAVLLVLGLGGLIMADDVNGQEKRKAPPPQPLKGRYTEYVTWERIGKNGDVTWTADVGAYEMPKGVWHLRSADFRDGTPAKGDRLTLKNGDVFTIKDVKQGGGDPNSPGMRCYVDVKK